jgi:hypothetical protein
MKEECNVMMKPIRSGSVLLLALLLSACNAGVSMVMATPPLAPTTAPAMAFPATPTAAPAPTTPLPTRPPHTIDLGEGRWIATHSFEGQDQARNYTINAQWPVVEGVTTPQIEQFNLAAQTLMSDTLAGFQQMITEPLLGQGGSIYFNYRVINASNGLLSILFDVSTYTGGAHGNTVHVPLNFDLNTGQALTFADVFKPGVDVINTLAVIASDELTRTNRLMFPEGAEPRPENYQVWNFDFNGLLITFDQYQVMPYAAGPQTVAIPYYELKADLKPDSPLADFWNLTNR